MPHCQKENHNRAGKSKKERQKVKQEAASRKKRLQEEKAAAEAEAALKISNNIAPVEGHGAYEIGCEPEPEYHRFNVKKRSKKHLRNDLRKRMLREAQEEEERLKKQQEEEYRQQQLALKEASGEVSSEEEEEEEPPVLEYFVFICECCDKRYATKNQFLNHTKSKKHRSKVRIFEDLGLMVTHVELRGENGNEKELYDDYEDDDEDASDDENNNAICKPARMSNGDDDGESEDDESEEESDEDDFVAPKRNNVFAAFSAGFSSSSEDEDSEDESDSDDEDRKRPPAPRRKDPPPSSKVEDEKKDDDDNIDFDELIKQNQLIQNEIDAQDNVAKLPPTPMPFHETYDPENYGVNENRLASVQHRLRKNLAAKGIEPSARNAPDGYDSFEAITMGKTLLQEVLEANIDTLQQKLDAYNKHKQHCQLMCKQYALAKGNSKAIPSQYIFKQDAADNSRRRANVHHAGSHYHMQAARTMQFGRQKGLMARHSSQGARLQASRMAAKESARMQQGGGGMKIGKTSKKSNQKRRGQAGGSKKSGGAKGKGDGGGD
eukprot:CAMPEP_0116139922 /NCGR_PEP_ID=MMETSP0329-20121206/13565_1 /TAXON_ID=697910 /ORGANISM="Pseudo-nitzschia arenysensis, Strain B593" /LENGTH=548 /DNA_ID=CAMNT_0003634987 /DNA_START=146 /DNA_END=1792 /DNA_ORIENTATION=-